MDISGLDAAYKLVILAAVAFKKDIHIEDVYYEGIDTITLTDITRATELGYKIKLLAIGEYHTDSTMNFRVHTTLVHETHPLSTINNEVNAVYVVGNMVGEALLTGKGAGGAPTGSAVVSDIIDIAFDIQRQSHRNLETDLASITTSTIDTASPGFFLRIEVSDHSSVLEHISGILGKSNINISKILQKSISESTAEIIIITYPVLESTMKTVMTQLNDHPEVIKAYNYIRVLSQ